MLKDEIRKAMYEAKEHSVNLLEILKKSKYDCLIWGIGSLSVSVRKLLESNDIIIAGYIVDNGGCKEINGCPIYTREDIRKQKKKFDVVLGHSRYELADAFQNDLGECVDGVFCLSDVCYGQWDKPNFDKCISMIDDFVEIATVFEDQASRERLKAFIQCKISGDYRFLLPFSDSVSYYNNPFFKVSHESYVDMGAYNGDSIKDFINSDPAYRNILAFEPDRISFGALSQYAKSIKNNIYLFMLGGWNRKTTLSFSETDESSSIVDGQGSDSIMVDRLDSVLDGEKVTLIKINYFYGVKETLEGAEKILMEQKPNIVITVGFDMFSIIDITKIIKKINPQYRLSLRFGSAMPARLFLYAY